MMFWALGVTVVKVGILLFYWRVFSIERGFRRRVAMAGAIILANGVAIFLCSMLQCNPISRF